MKTINKVILWGWVVIFTLFALVQVNDPDPYVWIPVYLAFALMAVSVLYRPLPLAVYLIAAAIAATWAIVQWPEKWEGIGDEMLNENTEQAREALGLLICAWSAIQYFLIARRLK